LLASDAPGRLLAYICLIAVVAIIPLIQVWLSKLVVNAVTSSSTHKYILPLALLYVSTFLASSVLRPLLDMMSSWLEDRTVGSIDRALMGASEQMVDLYEIESPSYIDRMWALETSALFLPKIFLAFQEILSKLIILLGIMLFLGTLHPLLPIAMAGLTLPHIIVVNKHNLLAYQEMKALSRSAREMDYCMRLATAPQSAKEIRVFGLTNFLINRFDQFLHATLSEMTRIRFRGTQISLLMAGLHAAGLSLGIWYVASQAAEGHLNVGDVVFYLFAVMTAQAELVTLPMWASTFFDARIYLQDLFSFIDEAQPAIRLPGKHQGIALPQSPFSIEFRRVSFSYPKSQRQALTGVSFTVPRGKVTALVGANGAGKSTIVKLITRMYDPQEGTILVNDIPIWNYNLESLRSSIAVVHQDFARFALTLGENIALGDPSGKTSQDRVIMAAKLSGADQTAAKLPQGYNTQLTRMFEGGVELSGGEWQQIALARAFVRDAQLVILDEPTAALDAQAERELFARFRKLIEGHTAIIISHRLSTVSMADHIVVLANGTVVEQGNHPQLLALGGYYAEMFNMQAKWYR